MTPVGRSFFAFCILHCNSHRHEGEDGEMVGLSVDEVGAVRAY